jgi:mutator protein MutT
MSATGETPRPVQPIAAAVVLLHGRVLVQTRPAGRSYGGWWEFPGGKVEPGEDAAACAARECREELGLDVAVEAPLHVQRWDYPGAKVSVTFLLCRPLDPTRAMEAAHPREGQELLWADAADLQRLRFLPANAKVLQLLTARLSRDPTA